MPTPHRVLIISPAWIGDAVMAQSLYKRLIERHPQLELDVLAPSWVAPLLKRMPEVRDIIENPFPHGALQLMARYRFAKTLINKQYQEAYILPNSLKSALIPWFAGIPVRIGFTGEARYGLINRRHTLDPIRLPKMVERFSKLAETVEDDTRPPFLKPSLRSTQDMQEESLRALSLSKNQPVAVLCPGAEYGPAKRWPPQHFSALADQLANAGYTVWLLGSGKDASIGAEIVEKSRSAPLNLCGKTKLTQAIDLIALSELVVCNDSGLMHIAAALNRPTIALYGSSSPEFTPPLTEKAKILSLTLECRPCFQRECPLKHLACLNNLSPQEVFSSCMAMASQNV